MANIDLYANGIEAALREESVGKATLLTMTLMIGYFGSCKSLLDAVAIGLNQIHNLKLGHREQDFGKPKFWNRLRETNTDTFERYRPKKSLADEIIKWRDSAIHRQAPIILPSHTTGEIPREEITLWLINSPEPHIDRNIISVPTGQDVKIDPRSLHAQWRSDFIWLCGQICKDIAEWSETV